MFSSFPLDRCQWLRHRRRNRLHTFLLLGFLGGYLFLLGWMIWGSAAAVWLPVLLGGLLLLFPGASPAVLMRLYGGRPLDGRDGGRIYLLVERLSRRAGLKRLPALYLLPTQTAERFCRRDPGRTAYRRFRRLGQTAESTRTGRRPGA